MRENPIKMDDLGEKTTIFGNIHIDLSEKSTGTLALPIRHFDAAGSFRSGNKATKESLTKVLVKRQGKSLSMPIHSD